MKRKGLGENEIDSGVARPADLLFEHRGRFAAGFFGGGGVVNVGVANVAGDEDAPAFVFGGGLLGERERVFVERLEQVLFADNAQFVAVAVISESDHHIRSGAQMLAVQLQDRVGMLQHDFGHKRARLQIAAPLQFEKITLGANHRGGLQTLDQSSHFLSPFCAVLSFGESRRLGSNGSTETRNRQPFAARNLIAPLRAFGAARVLG